MRLLGPRPWRAADPARAAALLSLLPLYAGAAPATFCTCIDAYSTFMQRASSRYQAEVVQRAAASAAPRYARTRAALAEVWTDLMREETPPAAKRLRALHAPTCEVRPCSTPGPAKRLRGRRRDTTAPTALGDPRRSCTRRCLTRCSTEPYRAACRRLNLCGTRPQYSSRRSATGAWPAPAAGAVDVRLQGAG